MHSSLTSGDHSEKEVHWEVTLILIVAKFLKAHQTLLLLALEDSGLGFIVLNPQNA